MRPQTLLDHVITTLEKHRITSPRILLALSGGSDSVVLFDLLRQLHMFGTIQLACAHINHQWRDEHSDADAAFCQQLCARHDITLYTGHASDIVPQLPAHKQKIDSPEARARAVRRFFLEKTATQYNYPTIALAHHQDDQIETFLIRLVRGSSLRGLSGMQAYDGRYFRPLLSIRKERLTQYLEEEELLSKHDHSNDDQRYLRNRIRQHAVPALLSCDERSYANIQATLTRLQKADACLTTLTHRTREQIMSTTPGHYLRDQFLSLPEELQKRLLIVLLVEKNIPFTPSDRLLNELIRFLATSTQPFHTLFEHHGIGKHNNSFWLE